MAKNVELSCRACGGRVVDLEAAKALVKRDYNYTDEELEAGAVKVWHSDCAVADGRLDNAADATDEFYWEFVPFQPR